MVPALCFANRILGAGSLGRSDARRLFAAPYRVTVGGFGDGVSSKSTSLSRPERVSRTVLTGLWARASHAASGSSASPGFTPSS
jgi:hypothetical protein